MAHDRRQHTCRAKYWLMDMADATIPLRPVAQKRGCRASDFAHEAA